MKARRILAAKSKEAKAAAGNRRHNMLVDQFKRKSKIRKNPYDDIERAILVKAADAPVQKKSRAEKEKDGEELDEDIEPEYNGAYIRRRALVDQMLI